MSDHEHEAASPNDAPPGGSNPNNLVILVLVILSASTLILLAPLFVAYYDGMRQEAVSDRLARYDDLQPLNEAHAAWEAGSRTIDDDIVRFAAGRPGLVAPRQTEPMNLDPLRGWNQLPNEIVEPEPEPPLEEPSELQPDTVSPEAIERLEDDAMPPPGAPAEALPQPEPPPEPRTGAVAPEAGSRPTGARRAGGGAADEPAPARRRAPPAAAPEEEEEPAAPAADGE
ncbi:MAG: hypothetical protein AB7S26_09540 [Sandaracinaceae bacterium]